MDIFYEIYDSFDCQQGKGVANGPIVEEHTAMLLEKMCINWDRLSVPRRFSRDIIFFSQFSSLRHSITHLDELWRSTTVYKSYFSYCRPSLRASPSIILISLSLSLSPLHPSVRVFPHFHEAPQCTRHPLTTIWTPPTTAMLLLQTCSSHLSTTKISRTLKPYKTPLIGFAVLLFVVLCWLHVESLKDVSLIN